MRAVVVIAVGFALGFVGAARAESRFECRAERKLVCEAGQCEPAATVDSWSVLYVASEDYARCDPRGCDRYDAHARASGAFINIDLPGRSMWAKIGDDGSFVEAAALGGTVVLSFGRCVGRAE